MEDVIVTSKREARRRTKIDGGSLQKHLDTIAREAGRRHWADFKANPAPIAENPLDRLVREAEEDGYDGLEIDIGNHVPENLGPIFVKAFRSTAKDLQIDLFRLSWDDIVHLAPAIRRRFEKPSDNACWKTNCGGREVFLYNHLDATMAFHVPNMGGSWTKIHDMRPHEAFDRIGHIKGWWRGREGRSFEDLVKDHDLHRHHVRKLSLVMACPSAPTVRYDPFCASVVPSDHPQPNLARAHFDAVAELVLPDGPDAADMRSVFSEIALRMKRRTIRVDWGERSAGLPDVANLTGVIWKEMQNNPVPPRLAHMSPSRLTSVVNQMATKMQRFASGPLASATDGVGQKLRQEKVWTLWSDEVLKEFMAAHPGKSTSGPEADRWMSDAQGRPGAPVIPDRYHYG